MQEQSTSLYYRDAGSDKEYHAQLMAKDGGFVVAFQYGPRGRTLTSGFKTKEPVAYEVAKKAYDKLVKEKMGKGYSPGEAGSTFVGTELQERFTGIVPQLLNAIDEQMAHALIDDPAWVAEEKFDGHRRLVQRTPEQLLGINRKGLVTGLPAEVASALAALCGHGPFVVDGELVGARYVLFDVLEWKGTSVRELPLLHRLEVRQEIEQLLSGQSHGAAQVAFTAHGTEQKRALYQAMRAAGKEGVVFKRLDAAYVAGRPNSGGNQLKRKFTHSASVLVAGQSASKRSVSMELFDSLGKKVVVGNVTIPANYDVPPVGAIVEVEYLYAYDGGSLYQPQYKGIRDDLDASSACVVSQLHIKPAGGAGEDSEDN